MSEGKGTKRGPMFVPLKTKCGLGRCCVTKNLTKQETEPAQDEPAAVAADTADAAVTKDATQPVINDSTAKLQDCAACKEISYCGRDHQTEHFKEGHKLICKGRTKGAPLKFQECVEKATSYFEREMWVAALPYYAAILELTERSVGLFHGQCVLALDGMATCYLKMEKFDHHQECIQRIVLTKDMYHDGSVAYSKDMYNLTGRLAEAHILAGNIPMAKAILEKTESEATENFGVDSFERGKALMALAGCSERQENTDEAVAFLQKAISVSGYGSPQGKEDKAKAANGYFNLGLVFFNLNRFAEAVPHFEKAFLFRVQGGVPGDHPDMTEAKTYLANARKAMTDQAASS